MLLPPPIVVVVVILISILSVRQTKRRRSQSVVFCVSFLSSLCCCCFLFFCFFFLACVCLLKKFRHSCCCFLSHVFRFSRGSFFFLFFLFSRVKILSVHHPSKVKTTVGLSRSSSKILAATLISGATFSISIRRQRVVWWRSFYVREMMI